MDYFTITNKVIEEQKKEIEKLKLENERLQKLYAERMNDCIRLKTQLSNGRKFKAL